MGELYNSAIRMSAEGIVSTTGNRVDTNRDLSRRMPKKEHYWLKNGASPDYGPAALCELINRHSVVASCHFHHRAGHNSDHSRGSVWLAVLVMFDTVAPSYVSSNQDSVSRAARITAFTTCPPAEAGYIFVPLATSQSFCQPCSIAHRCLHPQ